MTLKEKIAKAKEELESLELQQRLEEHYAPELAELIKNMADEGWKYDMNAFSYPFRKDFKSFLIGMEIDGRKIKFAHITSEGADLGYENHFKTVTARTDNVYPVALEAAALLSPKAYGFEIDICVVAEKFDEIDPDKIWEEFKIKLYDYEWRPKPSPKKLS